MKAKRRVGRKKSEDERRRPSSGKMRRLRMENWKHPKIRKIASPKWKKHFGMGKRSEIVNMKKIGR